MQRRLTAATRRAVAAGILEDRELNETSWIETCRGLEQQNAQIQRHPDGKDLATTPCITTASAFTSQ